MFRTQSISTTPDPLDYRLAALNILHHGQFSFAPPEYNAPQLLRTPVYPFLLAGTYLFDGETGLVMIILQSLMLVGMGWLLFYLLLVFRVPEKISLVLVALYLFEPLQWLYTLHTMTETTSSLLVLALITGALVGRRVSDFSRAALYGIVLGLAVLVKPSVMMWVPFLLLLVLCTTQTWRVRFVHIGIALALFVFTLTPWMIRNAHLTGAPVVSSSSNYALVFMFSGIPDIVLPGHRDNILPATYWDVVKMAEYNGHSNQVWYAYTTNAYESLVAANHAILKHLDYFSFISHQLACVPQAWFGNTYGDEHWHEYDLITSFILGPNAMRTKIISATDLVIWTAVLLFTLLGSFLLIRERKLRYLFLPLLFMLCATVFVNYCASWVRMLLPVYPVIFVATGVGVTFLLQKFSRTRI
jgi:4-amino-4-deoxy-L-arabinose transferase-like glycosyltransferase